MFWLTLARGIFALVLGILLFFYPDKTRPLLVNFIGMYWLMSGLLSVGWGLRGDRAQGWSLLAGIVAILGGITLIARLLLRGLMPELLIIFILAFVCLLSGIIHLWGGLKADESGSRSRSLGTILLGLFEIVLAITLAIAPLARGPLLHFLLSGWALIGGFVLILDALRQRRWAITHSNLHTG